MTRVKCRWSVCSPGFPGRLGDGSKRTEAVYIRYRMHSQCFLMKTPLKASSSAAWLAADALIYTASVR